MSRELLLVDLLSPVFAGACLPSLRRVPVTELASDGSSLLDCELLDESFERLDGVLFEDDVSRGDGSAAGFLGGGGKLDGSGVCARVGSGCMLSSTSAAKLPMAGDGSRTAVFDGGLA